MLLVAEAYGYRGGRVTGVPLTSEAIIESDPTFRRWFPSLANGYASCGERGALRTESTASIVWRLFGELEALTTRSSLVRGETFPIACWNIVPVHPYDPVCGQWSNRPPRRAEIDAGAVVCRDLIVLLRPQVVVAVGKCAARGLSTIDVAHAVVRHPSQGGAGLFRHQTTELLSN